MKRLSLLFFLVLALGCGVWLFVNVVPSPDPAVSSVEGDLNPLHEQISTLLDTWFKTEKLSGSFLVGRSSEIIGEGYYGYANPKEKLIVNATTQFNIGSLAKQFTGLLLLQLVEAGAVNLSDPVHIHIPELKETEVGRVTISQLNDMTSGLPYLLKKSTFIGLQVLRKKWTEDDFINEIKNYKLEFDPGSRFQYSNVGYSLLGIIVGRIHQKPWRTVIRESILEPFQMNNTVVECGETPPSNLAVGMIPFFGNSFLLLPRWNYTGILGAGGIVSTVRDLFRWQRGLTEFTKSQPLWAQEYFGASGMGQYSYGWNKKSFSLNTGASFDVFLHDGEDPGYCSAVFRIPSKEAVAIFLWNTDYCHKREWNEKFQKLMEPVLKIMASL